MDGIEHKLLELKEKISSLSRQINVVDGEINANLERLRKFNCEDEAQAEKRIKKIDKIIEKREIFFEKKMERVSGLATQWLQGESEND